MIWVETRDKASLPKHSLVKTILIFILQVIQTSSHGYIVLFVRLWQTVWYFQTTKDYTRYISQCVSQRVFYFVWKYKMWYKLSHEPEPQESCLKSMKAMIQPEREQMQHRSLNAIYYEPVSSVSAKESGSTADITWLS